jgi:polar amino acid transport system substrate-binding protein
MKKNVMFVISILALAGMLLSACAPAAAPAAPEAAPKVVRVATDATWPPFEVVDESTKEIIGLDIDLFNAVAAKAGLTLEYVNVGFDPLLAGISQCQYDAAISAITITEERKQTMLFSDPYYDAGQVVTIKKSTTDVKGKDDLVGKSIGVQLGTTGAIEAANIKDATLKSYDSIDLAYQDLLNGQVDAVIADYPLALGFIGKNKDTLVTAGEPFTSEKYGIAICNKNTELQAAINKGLTEVLAEGLVDKLNEKWVMSGE